MLRPGEALSAVARRCEKVLGASAYARRHGQPRAMMGGTWGHSLGLDWGSPWIEPTSSTVILPGMCFAIEQRIEAPGIGGANYENDVIVTDAGPRSSPQPPTATVSNEHQAPARTAFISLAPGERYRLD